MRRTLVRVLLWSVIVLLAMTSVLLLHLYFEGRPAQGRPQYVAMGSSFASGPAVTTAAVHSPWFCVRSRDNYAHQLARLRALSLVDVSCGGATTRHILKGGQLLQPAQIEAVTGETELVTLTIGGNDIAYLGTLMAMGCDERTPWYVRVIGGCRVRTVEETEQKLPKLHDQLVAIIQEVRHRAPNARLVLVNYPAVLPEQGSCAQLGLDEDEAAQMRIIAAKLAELTYAAAEGHGALLLDAHALTRGHDVCAQDPWINELHPAAGLLGAPLHPRLAGMTAIAQGLNALVGTR